MKAVYYTDNTEFTDELHHIMNLQPVDMNANAKYKHTMFNFNADALGIDVHTELANVLVETIYSNPYRCVGLAIPSDDRFEMQSAINMSIASYTQGTKRNYNSWDGLPNHSTYMWESDTYSRIILTTYEEILSCCAFRGRHIDYLIMLNMHCNKQFDDWCKSMLPVQFSSGSGRTIILGNAEDNNAVAHGKYMELWSATNIFTKIRLF